MGKHKINDEPVDTPSKKKAKKGAQTEETEVADQSMDQSQDVMETTDIVSMADMTYTQKIQYASAIASPLAGKKLTKKLLKLVKKAYAVKNIRSGLREVQKRLRKGDKGLVVFAADVTPIEIMCHLPAVCEGLDVPYCYVPLRRDIADAMGVRRPTLMVLVLEKKGDESFSQYEDLFEECKQAIKELPLFSDIAA